MPRVQSVQREHQQHEDWPPDFTNQQAASQHHKDSDGGSSRATAATASTIALDNISRLQMSDHRLAETARLAAETIPWDSLRGRNFVWNRKKTLGDFEIYTRRSGDVHHVMASGSVACSLTEMQHILRTTTNERYLAAMTELYGSHFLSGAVVHRINTSDVAAAAQQAQPRPAAAVAGFDLSVKTATFAKAHMFARNEQWCYLDFFQLHPESHRFALTMRSLLPADILLASTLNEGHREAAESTSSKKQLQEMTSGYSVVADRERNLVWVVFYAHFADSNTSRKGQKNKNQASKSTIKSRLMKMAKATCCLPMLVRRRRLGVQVFADPKAFTPANTHCICCTAALLMLTRKKRCYLCGYSVCLKCSSKQQMERSRGQLDMVRVCSTCSRRVNAANYDHIPNGTFSPTAIRRSPPNAEPSSQTLARLLRASFENAEELSRKQAVVQVVKHLLEQEESNLVRSSRVAPPALRQRATDSAPLSPIRSESSLQRGATSSASSPRTRAKSSDPATRDTLEADRMDDLEYYYMNGLESRLHVEEIALEECVWGNAEARTYPLSYKDDDPDGVPHHPVPEDEERRVNLVRQRRLSEILNIPELEIICSIASKELQCSAGLITIVDKEVVHIIASSDAGYKNQAVPRDESLCSHLVMSDKPLFFPHPGADIRVNKMGNVEQGHIRFYCGFPLTASDNTVVGSVCCVDSESHDLTQSQYATMAKLASTASRLVEMHARARAA